MFTLCRCRCRLAADSLKKPKQTVGFSKACVEVQHNTKNCTESQVPRRNSKLQLSFFFLISIISIISEFTWYRTKTYRHSLAHLGPIFGHQDSRSFQHSMLPDRLQGWPAGNGKCHPGISWCWSGPPIHSPCSRSKWHKPKRHSLGYSELENSNRNKTAAVVSAHFRPSQFKANGLLQQCPIMQGRGTMSFHSSVQARFSTSVVHQTLKGEPDWIVSTHFCFRVQWSPPSYCSHSNQFVRNVVTLNYDKQTKTFVCKMKPPKRKWVCT